MQHGARQLPIRHLSNRLPWHDSGWNGTVCAAPSKNSWCLVLKRIREERNATAEEDVAGSAWSDLNDAQLPACLTERAAALNAKPYSLRSRHPFAVSSAETHGHFAENGRENAKGERLVTSQNGTDGAIDSAKIRQQVRDLFDL